MVQVVLTTIFYVWLFLVLLLLWLMWLSNMKLTRQFQSTLISATVTSAEAAQKSADAAKTLATLMEHKSHAD